VNVKAGNDDTKEANSNHQLNFETANNKLRRKELVSNKCENNNIIKSQQSQPIPVVVNKYVTLDSLQEDRRHYITIVGPIK
jgi:transcription elongation GreA/GreB family factor